jgi:hypothetical protein
MVSCFHWVSVVGEVFCLVVNAIVVFSTCTKDLQDGPRCESYFQGSVELPVCPDRASDSSVRFMIAVCGVVSAVLTFLQAHFLEDISRAAGTVAQSQKRKTVKDDDIGMWSSHSPTVCCRDCAPL